MTREEEIDAAMETAAKCRADASTYRQIGWKIYADWLLANAKAAERWAAKR